ncbi:MAG TPA: c-type cytochrome [Burkholderiales bacterium]|nr:c-type cytochrome [Burkholderiales bacterium]
MKRFLVSVACAAALAGCGEREQPPAKPAAKAPAAAAVPGDVKAGKTFADANCQECHGMDGGSVAPGVPHLAAQSEPYLLGALKAYKDGKRQHAALKVITERMGEADIRNVSAYYASLPAAGVLQAKDISVASPYDLGKTRAAACAKCHREDGNSATPGIPSLAGQKARYLVVALQEYVRGERKSSPMHSVMRSLSPVESEAIAIYFASQTPAERSAPAGADPAAGAALTAVCSGCHGLHGVSADSMTPNLAGQDYRYLVEAIKAYRTTRKREKMRLYITGLGEKEINNIAAYYATQKAGPAERGQTMVKDLTEKCDRCHAAAGDNAAMVVPKIAGQDRDYLIMAMRAYRDERRESTAMHIMSLPYGDAVIESIASYYASQPAK